MWRWATRWRRTASGTWTTGGASPAAGLPRCLVPGTWHRTACSGRSVSRRPARRPRRRLRRTWCWSCGRWQRASTRGWRSGRPPCRWSSTCSSTNRSRGDRRILLRCGSGAGGCLRAGWRILPPVRRSGVTFHPTCSNSSWRSKRARKRLCPQRNRPVSVIGIPGRGATTGLWVPADPPRASPFLLQTLIMP